MILISDISWHKYALNLIGKLATLVYRQDGVRSLLCGYKKGNYLFKGWEQPSLKIKSRRKDKNQANKSIILTICKGVISSLLHVKVERLFYTCKLSKFYFKGKLLYFTQYITLCNVLESLNNLLQRDILWFT
jgi:hypothetical protein